MKLVMIFAFSIIILSCSNEETNNSYSSSQEKKSNTSNSVIYDPNGPDRDCGDFTNWNDANNFFIAAGGPSIDRHRLDGDNDGIPCESLR
tara:strand:- start:382 stop:651 length:270 start_codon:yes stop_codon:yes gene_type:complete